jgi:polyhydroxyalkanoate synthesis regulator phasin
MKIYDCPRCGFTSKIKTKFINHLRRKNICDPILSKTKLQKEYIKYGIKEGIQMNPKESIDESKFGFMNPNESKRIHFCKYCEKVYSTSSNLSKHLKKCKDKIKTDQANHYMQELVKLLNEKDDKISKYDQELEEKNKQINELIQKAGISNSTITQNIQNNIKLLAYDKTDISDLTEKDFIKCFNHNNMCVPHLLKRIHFNRKKPENHNVLLSNLKSGHIMLYDGKQWNTYNRDEVIDDMFDEKHDILEQKYEEWVDIGKDFPILYHKFRRYLEKINNDVVMKKIKKEMKFVLYNNRNVVKKIK